MSSHAGGCLCGRVRYETRTSPLRVTYCHCRFCQRATGAAYMVEPIFRREDLAVTAGTPKLFELTSAGSGKNVRVHFCDSCGTKLYLTFERFPDVCGVYAGTFDEPDWFDVEQANAKQIFVDVARHDTVLMPGIGTFRAHSIDNQGAPQDGVVLDMPRIVGRPART